MKLSFYNPRRLSLLAGVLVVCGILLGTRIEKAFTLDNEFEELHKYQEVLSLVNKYYVDKVDIGDLNKAAIVGLLAKLDPHSVYMPPVNVKQSDEEFSGHFDGIGVQFTLNHDSILIENVIPDGPSEKVGLMPGDKIVAIDGRTTKGFTQDSVIKNLRGPKGTKVNVSIARYNTPSLLQFEITRDVIPLNSVTANFMVDDKTGYIALTHFIATSHDEMRKALEDLRAKGMQRLILDLRYNPGGYLEQAVEIADEFIGGTKTIVYTKGRVTAFDEVEVSHPGQSFEKVPLVVLVNNNSASASEIFSGAIQDLDRGVVVGENTFGKGLVQRQFPLQDGSAIRLTISRYYTASGRSIQRAYTGGKYTKGIDDVVNNDADDEDNFTHNGDNSKDTTRPKFKTASGRMIYGGGGITPDFIVKGDTLTRSTIQLLAASILYDYTLNYVTEHAAELKKKYTADAFVKEFAISDETFNMLVTKGMDKMKEEKAKAAKAGEAAGKTAEKVTDIDPKEIEIDKPRVKQWLRAEIGRQLFGSGVRYHVLLEGDKQFQKALSLIGEAQHMSEAFK
jgi:carboxyl-terminal processing protease